MPFYFGLYFTINKGLHTAYESKQNYNKSGNMVGEVLKR